MNGTFGACSERGMYVQGVMAAIFLLVVRVHMKGRCEPGSLPYKVVATVFKVRAWLQFYWLIYESLV